jgi:hypothetical protein
MTRMTLMRETEGDKGNEDPRFLRKKLCSLRYFLIEGVSLAYSSALLPRRRSRAETRRHQIFGAACHDQFLGRGAERRERE